MLWIRTTYIHTSGRRCDASSRHFEACWGAERRRLLTVRGHSPRSGHRLDEDRLTLRCVGIHSSFAARGESRKATKDSATYKYGGWKTRLVTAATPVVAADGIHFYLSIRRLRARPVKALRHGPALKSRCQ